MLSVRRSLMVVSATFWLLGGALLLLSGARPWRPWPTADARVAMLCVGGAMVLLALATLWRYGLNRHPRVALATHDGGRVFVGTAALQELCRRIACGQPGVRHAIASVQPEEDRLRVVVRASLSGEATLPELGRDLESRVRSEMRRIVGISVGEFQLDVAGFQSPAQGST